DDYGFVPGLFVLRNEEASVLRCDPEDVEEVGRRLREIDPFRVVRQSEISRRRLDSGEMLEDSILRAPVKEVGGGHLDQLAGRIEFLDCDDAFRCFVWQAAQQDTVDDAEDCSAGANAQRERDYYDCREARMLQQPSQPVANVLKY